MRDFIVHTSAHSSKMKVQRSLLICIMQKQSPIIVVALNVHTPQCRKSFASIIRLNIFRSVGEYAIKDIEHHLGLGSQSD